MNNTVPFPSPWLRQLADLTAGRHAVAVEGDHVLAATDVVMPSGEGITVTISGGRHGEAVSVSDGGAALDHVRAHGLILAPADLHAASRAAATWGVSFGDGEVRSGPVALADVGWAVSRVANAARDVATATLKSARRHHGAAFRDQVRLQLQRLFPDATISQGAHLAGASSRSYRFDYSVSMPGAGQLLLDLPTPEPSTIAATVVRNLDVRKRSDRRWRQVIAWDDTLRWPGEALEQLQLAGVPVVRSSALAPALADPGLFRGP